MPRFIFVPRKLLSKFKLLNLKLKKMTKNYIFIFINIRADDSKNFTVYIIFQKNEKLLETVFSKIKKKKSKKKKRSKTNWRKTREMHLSLPLTFSPIASLLSIPEEEKWGDVWQLYSRLIATEHRASVVHKFSYFSDERVPPKVVDKRSASWRGRRRGEEGIWYIELWYRGPSSLETRDWSRNGSVEDRAGVNMWKKIAVHVSLPISRQILLLSSSFSSSPLLFL